METKTYTILVTVTGETLPTEAELSAHIAQSDPAGATWSIAEADAFNGQRVHAECDHIAELIIRRHRERCERDKPKETEQRPPRRFPTLAQTQGGGGGPVEPF